MGKAGAMARGRFKAAFQKRGVRRQRCRWCSADRFGRFVIASYDVRGS